METANKFWQLQSLDKTDEEKEYEKLIQQLENMLVAYRDEVVQLETEFERLQGQRTDYQEVSARYKELRDEESRLLELQADIEKYKRRA